MPLIKKKTIIKKVKKKKKILPTYPNFFDYVTSNTHILLTIFAKKLNSSSAEFKTPRWWPNL